MQDLSSNRVKAVLMLQLQLEHYASVHGSAECHLTHIFADGVYTRQVELPAGTVAIGRRHKLATTNMLLKGTIVVTTDSDMPPQILHAPATFVSKAGDKKVVIALTDCTFANVIPTTLTDEKEIVLQYTEDDDPKLVAEIKEALCLSLQ